MSISLCHYFLILVRCRVDELKSFQVFLELFPRFFVSLFAFFFSTRRSKRVSYSFISFYHLKLLYMGFKAHLLALHSAQHGEGWAVLFCWTKKTFVNQVTLQKSQKKAITLNTYICGFLLNLITKKEIFVRASTIYL